MNLLVSIPLEQGNVLRQKPVFHLVARKNVSIPLEQGNVLRLKMQQAKKMTILSQSLWNRAMSYDFNQLSTCFEYRSLNPFGTGQCLTTVVGS